MNEMDQSFPLTITMIMIFLGVVVAVKAYPKIKGFIFVYLLFTSFILYTSVRYLFFQFQILQNVNVLEFIVDLIFIFLVVVIVISIIRLKRYTPTIIILYESILILYVLYEWLNSRFELLNLIEFLLSVLISGFWIIYFLRSKKVREVFVN
ncbi:DUF2569 family protein [Chengkuizengella sediminis]|uniref:DUF2569 family protein n=1 Tax=Chengkuizengella sediminis TaxID=1885917 RepID=UPI00138A2B8E|nr:hypothetical protein [Chengkuizengella sediminis]NDI34178.1 hypothetical protein [Chengkuizengella sediminis]